MNLGIAGKVALVTASSGGIGKAVAHVLAAEGAELVLFSRSERLLRATAREIQAQHNVPVLPVAGDMRSAEDVERLGDELKRRFETLDIFILNTGRPPHPQRKVLDETDDARWHEAFQTQLWAAIMVTRKVVPLMLNRGWGRVVAVTSASVKHPMPLHALSTVFRAGVTAYMKHLANEVATRGVTVNTVGPASINSDSANSSYRNNSALVAERVKRIPVGRLGKVDEFAATVAFLASDHAGFITGASLYVDGGMGPSLY